MLYPIELRTQVPRVYQPGRLRRIPWADHRGQARRGRRKKIPGPRRIDQPTLLGDDGGLEILASRRSLPSMPSVTLRVLHGADRGKIYSDVPTPVTIGREEGNTIQLNDERISRYHLKLQADNQKIVLTDLDSTNGTKVNGEEIHVRIIRDGDMISLGRSVLLVGSHSDIDRRIAEIAAKDSGEGSRRAQEMQRRLERAAEHHSDVIEDLGEARLPLLPGGPPPVPEHLSPAQSAELSELLDYVQAILRETADGAVMRPGHEQVEIDFAPWQGLLDLQARLAELLRQVAEPPPD